MLLLLLVGCSFCAATIWGWLVFERGVYFLVYKIYPTKSQIPNSILHCHTSNSHESMRVNREALQLPAVYKKPYFLLQVVWESVSGTTSHVHINQSIQSKWLCNLQKCNQPKQAFGTKSISILHSLNAQWNRRSYDKVIMTIVPSYTGKEVQEGLKFPRFILVATYLHLLKPFLSFQLLTVVHSMIQTMVEWTHPRERLWTKWPIIRVTINIYWLETRHVPARQMECGLEMNLSVVRLLDIHCT